MSTQPRKAGGYIHAPSLAHAATAGVLRSGYLTHNPDAAGSAALAIDLSSARVRRALELLDGVRQGQPLGALIGYLIERRLHKERLDVYTLSLRSLAPMAAGQLVSRADTLPPSAQEAIAATGVVDGIRLLQLSHTDIWTKLKDPPADNPYIAGAARRAPTTTSRPAIAGDPRRSPPMLRRSLRRTPRGIGTPPRPGQHRTRGSRDGRSSRWRRTPGRT